jgi:hypothetical protein
MENEKPKGLTQTQEEIDSKENFIFAEKAKQYLIELQSCEFMIQNKLLCIVRECKVKEKSVIVGAHPKEVDGLECLIYFQEMPDEKIYYRCIPGRDDVTRYHLIYFVYKDIMNTGLMMFFGLYEEKIQQMKQYALAGKDKFQA